LFSLAVPIEDGSPTLLARVLAKVVEDPVTGCSNWIGAFSKKRRGMRPVIQLGGRGTRVVLVTRLVLTWYAGPPPTDRHEAGHICPHGENSRCVNPAHLVWQTREENEAQKRSYE
jgi:hypothetical protein